MRFLLFIIIGFFPLVFISCKPQGTTENIIKIRAKGVKPSVQPMPPAYYQPPVTPTTPTPPTPPPVTLPPTDSGDQPPPGAVNPVGDSLEVPEDPSWNLCPGVTPNDSELYDQTWIDTHFRQNREIDNYSKLYQGVSKLIVPYSKSGGFLAYGENSFAAITVPGKKQAAFAAGSTLDSGKIFVFGYSGWISSFSPYSPISFQNAPVGWDNQITYLKNVLIWLLGDSYKNLVYAGGAPKNFLTNWNLNFHSDFRLTKSLVTNFPNPIDPITYPLVVVGYTNLNDQDVDSLIDYVKRGGNILIGVWPNYGANTEYIDKILKPTGISYYATYSQSTDFNKPSVVDLKNSQFNLHSFYSLAALEKNNGDITLINKRKDEISLFPKDDPVFSCKIVKDFQNVSLPFPMKKNDSLFKYSLLLFRNYYGKATPDQEPGVPVPEAVNDFPGNVPIGSPLVERSLSFNLKFSTRANYRENFAPLNWQATGLYAPPGQIIRVEVTNADPNALMDFRIVINTHTDDLTWIDGAINLNRHPILPTYHSLKLGENRIRNPYGGLIVLEGTKESNQDKKIDLTIRDAVEAAWLKEDTTDTELTRMKTLSAPWAMIQGQRSVAVVPISTFNQIASAKPLIDAWTYIHVLEENLGGKTATGTYFPDTGNPSDWLIPHKWPDGRTWHVADKQIESGNAHAGNPVMYDNTVYNYGLNMFIKPTKLLSDSWTLWHERGHNHQQTTWTTGLDQEVTVNILSSYMQDNGYKYIDPPISPPPFRIEITAGFKYTVNRLRTGYADIYKTSGPTCSGPSSPNNCPAGTELNNSDPYRRLIFFLQLIRYTEKNPAPGGKKGYDIISELYSRVRKYDQTFYDSIKYDDTKKTDNLYVELSDITQIDLTDFFQRWGRSVSGSAKTTVQGGGYLQPPTDKPPWKCDPYNPAVDNPC